MSAIHYTTGNGDPVYNDQCSQTAGANGPVLLQDFHLIDKLSHFDRERIPERVVHAKGAGAFGYFECTTDDMKRYTRAVPFVQKGKRTNVVARFSTVGGEKASPDTARDPRGFAVKFYTEQGNWDFVGNNTPVFFIRDPLKFPDFIHTQKRHPQTNLKDADMFWDFLSLVPESIHQTTILFSERGTPYSYRFMNGYSSHTFGLVNDQGKMTFVKFHFKTDQGIRNLTASDAERLAGSDPDHATRDLFEAIDRKEFPTWTLKVQLMTLEQASRYRWNVFDVTKVWPHKDFPLKTIGKLVLNRNPTNYFAEVEQAAFSPGHLIPGIIPSMDRMLQARLFSYPDTHRHRLGTANYTQIPVNQPVSAVNHHQRDGFMAINGNGGSEPNYNPNSTGKFKEKQDGLEEYVAISLPSASIGKFPIRLTDDDFKQAKALYDLQSVTDQQALVDNLAGAMGNAKSAIRERTLRNFERADSKWAARIRKGILKSHSKI